MFTKHDSFGSKSMTWQSALSKAISIVSLDVVLLSLSISASAQQFGTTPTSINDEGTVTGYFVNSTTATGPGAPVGFVRESNGNIASFAVPGSCGTYPAVISNVDAIAGNFGNCSGPGSAFIRRRSGKLTEFVVEG